jgi:hypothetical protein
MISLVKMWPRSLATMLAGIFLLAAIGGATPAAAGDIHYSLMLGTPLNDQTYRNNSAADYYSIVTTKRFSKFEYLIIPAPSCTNFLFPQFVKLAARLVKANTSGMKLLFYSRPVGGDGWQSYPLNSAGCTPYGSNGPSYYSTVMGKTGLAIPAVDIEALHFPSGVDVGTGLYNYLQAIAWNYQSTQPLWVWNTAYPEKFATGTGSFFTLDGSGNITGNSTLPPSLIQELGLVVWMDFHTMYAEAQAPRSFVDQRLQNVAALSGAKTSVQIGLTCLNGKVDLKGNSDQQVMSTAVAEGETVLMDAVTKAGVRNFNVYVALPNLKAPQWSAFYSFMNTSSTALPTQLNVSFRPPTKSGIAYGLGCLQE